MKDNIDELVSCEIKCSEHNIWFRSMILLCDYGSYKGTQIKNVTQTCPIGGEQVPCNKDNMRFYYKNEDGKVYVRQGIDTIFKPSKNSNRNPNRFKN